MNLNQKWNKRVREKLDNSFSEAAELAVAEVERLARVELRRNKKLSTFTMAMGTYYFSVKNFILYDYDEAEVLDDFIAEYDKDFHMTGSPMHFTATGEKIFDW